MVEVVDDGFRGGRWEGLGEDEFGGWLAGRCENRVFQQAQARGGTAGKELDLPGASPHPTSMVSHNHQPQPALSDNISLSLLHFFFLCLLSTLHPESTAVI